MHDVTLDIFYDVTGLKPWLESTLPDWGDNKVMHALAEEIDDDRKLYRKPYIESYAGELWLRGKSKQQFLDYVGLKEKVDPGNDPSYNYHTYAGLQSCSVALAGLA